jgi:hypothetical protein
MKLKLNNAEIVFAQLDNAVAKFGGEPKFSCCILVDKKSEDLTNFRAIVDKLQKDSFDGKELDISKLCVSDGDDKDYENFKGKIVFTMANKKRPITIGKQKQAVVAGDDEFPVSHIASRMLISTPTLTQLKTVRQKPAASGCNN